MNKNQLLKAYILQLLIGSLIIFLVNDNFFKLLILFVRFIKYEEKFSNIPSFFWLILGVFGLVINIKALINNWKDYGENDFKLSRRLITGSVFILFLSVSVFFIRLSISILLSI